MRNTITSSIKQGIRNTIGNILSSLRPVFHWPGTHTLAATTGTTPTFTRATSATFEDFEGLVRTAESSEPRFVGARRVENLLTASEDMTNAAYAFGGGSGFTLDSPTELTSNGTFDSIYQRISIVDDGSGFGGRTFVFSVSVRLVSGTITADSNVYLDMQGAAISNTANLNIGSAITSTPQRFVLTQSTDAGGSTIDAMLMSKNDAITLEITKWQLEEVTGQTNQNPSEYVSTGVLSTPYHGANIDGVQYFNTLNANTVTAGVVTEATGSALTAATTQFMEIDGVAGSYVSTPDSVANSIRQSIVIEADCAADDWDLVTSQTLNSKWGSGVSWLLGISGGLLRLNIGTNNSQPGVNSSLLGFSDGTRHKVRAAYDALTQIVTFSEFVDGDWIVISSAAIAAPFIDDISDSVRIGAYGTGGQPFNGKIYSSTVTKGPTPYPYVLLDGVSGTYVSTPDSAAASVTGDLTLIAWVAPDDWTPAATSSIITKWVSAGDQRSFLFRIVTDGTLQLITDVDGDISNNVTSFSTAATGFANGTGHWVRVSFDVSAGTVNFFTSDQPSDTPISILSWVQLGGANVAHAQTAIFDSTAAVEIGGYDGGSSPLSGKVSRAVVIASTDPTAAASVDFYPQPYLQGDTNFTSVTGEVWTLQGNAIATSPIDDGVKVDCDAGDYASGSTFVSSTSGETWTLNGNASVFQPPVDASGPFGYLAEGAGTNVCLQSNDFDTTWTKGGGSRVTSAYAIAPDGTNTAWQLLDSGATGVGEVYAYQWITVASGSSTYSIYVKEDQLNLVSLQTLDFDAGGNGTSFFNLATGAWGTQSANHTVHSQSLGNGWYRLAVSLSTASDLAGRVLVYCVATDGSNNNVPLDGTSSILIWGAQVEAGAFPSSYIATAAASVTRNADVLTAPAAGNADTFPMTINLNITPSALLANASAISVDDGSSDRAIIFQNGTDWGGYVAAGGVLQAQVVNGAVTPLGVPASLTVAAALNDTNFYFNGSSGTVDTACTMPATPTTIRIGARYDNAMQPYASIRNVKIFDERLTDAEVADL